jgi:hypothetical protein
MAVRTHDWKWKLITGVLAVVGASSLGMGSAAAETANRPTIGTPT